MIEITKACTIASMKAKNSLVVVQCREKKVNAKKAQKMVKICFFKALANRFWLTSKSHSWFNEVGHGQASIKWTSWKGKWSVTKSRLDVEFVKKITLEMVINQQVKEEGLDQNY